METKKVIQKLMQLMTDNCKKEIYNDYLDLKLNQTKELTDKMIKKYKLK
mgnify:CR=1 FL=1